jgi:hypothetical protein
MEKIVTIGGVQYTVRRRTTLNDVNTRYFKRMIALFYVGLAAILDAEAEQVATALLDFAHISGQTSGGSALLNRSDSPEVLQEKCKQWLTGDYAELCDELTTAVNEVNTVQPDRALAPEPLPESADFLARNAARRSRKKRAPTG